jgi:hypothetical protein
MYRALIALSLLVVGMAPVGAGVAMPPAARCQAGKIWVAGRYVARHPRCRTAACAAGWTQRLRRSFADLERGLPCITRDDAARVEGIAREFETKLAAMLRRRDRPCARLFTAATARLAGVRIRSQRPLWPPQDRQFSDEWHQTFDRFERDRVAAKGLRGCRSVILGSKLNVPASLVQRQTIEALLPPEVATGLRVDRPPGWRLHDVAPGSATFVTFAGEYAHGSHEMPPGGADLNVYVTNKSVDEWLGRWGDRESLEHVTIDGVEALRVTTKFDEDHTQRLDILVPGEGIALSSSWYIGDNHHPADVEQMIRAARFFGRSSDQSQVTPTSVPTEVPARAQR